MVSNLTAILILVMTIIISALPLYFSVKLLGGRTSIIKTILVMFLTGIICGFILLFFPFGVLIAFLVLIWIYREMFRLKWFKAFFVWILQIIFILIFIMIFSILGISFTIFSFMF